MKDIGFWGWVKSSIKSYTLDKTLLKLIKGRIRKTIKSYNVKLEEIDYKPTTNRPIINYLKRIKREEQTSTRVYWGVK